MSDVEPLLHDSGASQAQEETVQKAKGERVVFRGRTLSNAPESASFANFLPFLGQPRRGGERIVEACLAPVQAGRNNKRQQLAMTMQKQLA